MKHRATAILLAAMMVATGVSLSTTSVAQQPTDCAATFPIADDEDTALERVLLGGMEEVGVEEVEEGIPETLSIILESPNDQLRWEVFKVESDLSCEEYKPNDCAGTLNTRGELATCDLDAPADVISYHVHYENIESDRLTYKTFAS